jgi:hypothetical protein
MARIFGESIVLLFAVVLSLAIIAPAISAATSNLSSTPYDEAFLVMGMVYALVAPIGYFLAGAWWARAIALMAASVAAVLVAAAAYMFETHRPYEGVACLTVLTILVFIGERLYAALQNRRQAQLHALEAVIMMEISRAAREYGGMEEHSPTFLPIVTMVQQMAQSEAWAAIHQSKSLHEARCNVDHALAGLEKDLGQNSVIDSPLIAARLVTVIRSRVRASREYLGQSLPLVRV